MLDMYNKARYYCRRKSDCVFGATMEIPYDIEARIRTDFAKEDADPILDLLKELKSPSHDMEPNVAAWVLRCIVFLARGNFEQLVSAIELARFDPRDLIVSAEYEGWESKKVRNLNLPFRKISESTDQHDALRSL